MDTNRTPHEGQVYRSPSGRPALYVRTEHRSGRSAPEHLLIETGERVVLERWLPADAPFPARYELALDPQAVARADRLDAEMVELRRERDGLLGAIKAAVPLVPVATANELRRVYRETVGSTR